MIKVQKVILLLIIIFMTIVLHDFSNDSGQNIISIGVMACCPIILLINIKLIEKNDLYIIGVLILIFLSYYTSHKTFRISSAMYSAMFIVQFITYKTLLKRKLISIHHFRKLLLYIIYAFFACLIIQQVMEIIGINGFNRFGFFSERFKMNSLAQEPSALPPTIILLMYAIIRIDENIKGKINDFFIYIKKNKKIWFIFFYMIITCGSTTGIFITPILFLYFIKNNIFKYAPLTIIGCYLIFNAFQSISPHVTERASNIGNALLTFDPYTIYDIDPSASARIAPYLLYLQDFSFTNMKCWIGHGMDYATYHLSYLLLGKEYGSEIGIGGFISFIYDYGLLACFLFLAYMKKNTFKSFFSYDFIFWLCIFSVQDFRVTLFWLYFIVIKTIVYFKENTQLCK